MPTWSKLSAPSLIHSLEVRQPGCGLLPSRHAHRPGPLLAPLAAPAQIIYSVLFGGVGAASLALYTERYCPPADAPVHRRQARLSPAQALGEDGRVSHTVARPFLRPIYPVNGTIALTSRRSAGTHARNKKNEVSTVRKSQRSVKSKNTTQTLWGLHTWAMQPVTPS